MTPADTPLDKSAHQKIFEQKILARPQFLNASQQERPRAIILAGQPGAGKGGLVATAEAELLDDVVTVDPDELREFHPDVEQFCRARPYTWSSQTQHDAGQWADELLEASVAGKKC